tara:strand:+ start:3397 stop:4020 length:624 start_codon:yes stop_codon:yes gene_type:complete
MKILQNSFLTLFLVSAFFSCEFVNQKKQKDSDEEKTSVNEAEYSKKDFYGHWKNKSKVTFEETVEDYGYEATVNDNKYFHRADRFNEDGTIIIRFDRRSEIYSIMGGDFSYDFLGSGEWKLDEDYLVLTYSEVKFNDHISSYDYDKEQMEIYEVFKGAFQNEFIENEVASYKILEKDSKKMVLKEDIIGEIDEGVEYPEVVTYKRVD